jgi:hypothetical protein
VDIADPANPWIAGSVDTPGLARGVAVSLPYAYVADRTAGLQVIDVADPSDPQLVRTVATPGPAYAVAIARGHAYVAANGAGVQVVDIGDPLTANIVTSKPTLRYAWDVATSGTHIYAADGGAGLFLLGLVEPTDPLPVGGALSPGTPSGVSIRNGRAFLAAGESGLWVLNAQCESPLATAADAGGPGPAAISLRISPNPSFGDCLIRMQTRRTGPATAEIYDVAGRRVRTLVDGRLDAGWHQATWNGRDDAGLAVAPGVYFVRLRDEDSAVTRKLTRIR